MTVNPLSYAILATVKLAFWTLIAVAGSAAVAPSDTFSTATVKQQPLGTVMMAVDVTLKYSSTAAAVQRAINDELERTGERTGRRVHFIALKNAPGVVPEAVVFPPRE